jgi:hypothetical protein
MTRGLKQSTSSTSEMTRRRIRANNCLQTTDLDHLLHVCHVAENSRCSQQPTAQARVMGIKPLVKALA